VIAGFIDGDALDVQDDVTPDDECLAHDRCEHGPASERRTAGATRSSDSRA
jgi:hypothetical protein